MRLAAPGYRLRSHYYAYGSNVRNCFRSLHTKDPADTLHPESRASRRQDGVEVSRFYSRAAGFLVDVLDSPQCDLRDRNGKSKFC